MHYDYNVRTQGDCSKNSLTHEPCTLRHYSSHAMFAKVCAEFIVSVCAAVLAAVAFVYLWPYIDFFAYTKLLIVLAGDGLHAQPLVMLLFAAPIATASAVYILNKLFFRRGSIAGAAVSFFTASLMGGGLSILTLQVLQGAVAAVALLFITGATTTAGWHLALRIARQSDWQSTSSSTNPHVRALIARFQSRHKIKR